MSAIVKALPVTPISAIGKAYGGGFVTGVTVENGQRYLNITAGAAHELKGAWGARGVIIEGAGSFTDSRSNTESMAAAGSELAQKVLALVIDGHTDWAIPARDVQELQYRHLKPTSEENYCWGRDGDNPNSLPIGLLYNAVLPTQTTLPAFQDDGAEAFSGSWYWSSTQRSTDLAFLMDFDDGIQYGCVKDNELRVRPVRRELLID
ncbi:DUF1566 domain-containing protein [Pseudomonas lundensis]|uniref:DUF1566 domain-containing protein n=1 Tax=Pseudomonas lundensis TaxID=86185 RepID=UPI0018672C11|nr:DUF1566 domain-containing protein [Pseudomonas lundensis]